MESELNFLKKEELFKQAVYREQLVEEYRNNPFIEALPDILSIEEVIDKLSFFPKFIEEEKNLDSHIRLHLVQRLYEYFQPLPIHIDIENKISRIIRQGYISRNPISKNYTLSLNSGAKSIENKNINYFYNDYKTTALGLSVIGVSGMGKTTTINKILSNYPQVIVHSSYKNIPLSLYQVVWMKLDCPHDGSLKGLCLEFFRKVDELINTNYFLKYGQGRYAVNVLLPVMGQVARNIGLGILIIDEIQHLNLAKSQGAESMLNYFVTLVNTIGIPVILVGTLKSINILQSQFRQARRGSGQGDIIWERMKNDKMWELLIEGMWKYQWTKKRVELNDKYLDLLYEESQGIIDIVVKLFILSQIKAISTGKEVITPEIIKKVSNENLKMIKPAIEAIKSGDIKKIAKYEDLYTPIDVSNFIMKNEQEINLRNKIEYFKRDIGKSNKNIKEESILSLIELGVKSKTAKEIVEKLIIEGKEEKNEIIKEAYRRYLGIGEDKNKIIKQNEYDKKDLRGVFNEAKKTNRKIYDILLEKGHIKNSETLL